VERKFKRSVGEPDLVTENGYENSFSTAAIECEYSAARHLTLLVPAPLPGGELEIPVTFALREHQ